MLTRTLSSGNPPSTLRSQINECVAFEESEEFSPGMESHTLKRPAVSSEFRGKMEMHPMMGGGNVRKSSVWVHVAR